MNQDLIPYAGIVNNLLKPANEVRADMDKQSDATINMLHCAMGMAGEFFEMKFSKNAEEFRKELSDFLFYTVGAHIALGIPLPDTYQVDGQTLDPQVHMLNSMQMEQALLAILELTKKEFFQCKALDTEKAHQRVSALEFMMQGIASLSGNAGTNMAGLIETNTTKLTKRYGDSYSNEAAINRVDTK